MINKRNVLVLFVIFIGLAFALSLVIVTLTRGRSRRWLSYKMRIGGLLLSLVYVSEGCRVREATCYYPIGEYHGEITTGISGGFSGRKLHNNYISANIGIGSERYFRHRFGYETGIVFTRTYSASNVNYSLGPYLNGHTRIGYQTDIFVEGNYSFSLNKCIDGDLISFSTGISYPYLFILRAVGISASGNFIYSPRTGNTSFYPSIRLFYSIPYPSY